MKAYPSAPLPDGYPGGNGRLYDPPPPAPTPVADICAVVADPVVSPGPPVPLMPWNAERLAPFPPLTLPIPASPAEPLELDNVVHTPPLDAVPATPALPPNPAPAPPPPPPPPPVTTLPLCVTVESPPGRPFAPLITPFDPTTIETESPADTVFVARMPAPEPPPPPAPPGPPPWVPAPPAPPAPMTTTRTSVTPVGTVNVYVPGVLYVCDPYWRPPIISRRASIRSSGPR